MKNALILAPIALLALTVSSLRAQPWTWVPTTGDGLWNVPANWTDGVSNTTIPNAIGAATIFPAPTANRTITLSDGAGCTAQGGCNFTVGSISFTNNGAFTTTIRNNSTNTAGVASLNFDAAGAGPATVTVNLPNSTNQSLISADMVFTDTVTVNVISDVGNGTAGSISITGNITGPGGLIKDGPGMLTTAFVSGSTSQLKEYTGPTIINNGRWRASLNMGVGGIPTKTSSVTINNGGQMNPLGSGTVKFGDGTVPFNLNGAGPTSGAFAPFPGAIRPDTNAGVNISNPVTLQSAATVHMQGSTSGLLWFLNTIDGPGTFVVGSIPHDANIGTVRLGGASSPITNAYTGGTIVNAGTLRADFNSINAFGTNTVQVVSANLASAGSQAHIVIDDSGSGSIDAIANNAFLNLAGGGAAAGVADDGYADLQNSSFTETIGGLMLGGTIFGPGVYGSTASGAANPGLANPNEFFTGPGTVTVSATACNGGVCVPGDYNNNTVVDAGDYVLWRKGGPLANDFTPGVQAADYDFWRSRFATITNPGSGTGLELAGVPEPSSFVLVGSLVSLLALSRRKSVRV